MSKHDAASTSVIAPFWRERCRMFVRSSVWRARSTHCFPLFPHWLSERYASEPFAFITLWEMRIRRRRLSSLSSWLIIRRRFVRGCCDSSLGMYSIWTFDHRLGGCCSSIESRSLARIISKNWLLEMGRGEGLTMCCGGSMLRSQVLWWPRWHPEGEVRVFSGHFR